MVQACRRRLLVVLAGCVGEPHPPYQPVPVAYDNPIPIPITNYDAVWDGVVDVVSQNFRIEHEDPVRPSATPFTGRIDTFPMPGADLAGTVVYDSANSYQRLETTLQSIRRYAVVRVIPAQNGGYWVDVAVYKELENLRQPEYATAGSATFRNDASLAPRASPDHRPPATQKWIPQGRDAAAEQRIIGQILDRFTPAGTPVPLN